MKNAALASALVAAGLATMPAGASGAITLPNPAEAAALPRAVTILGVKPGEFPNKAPGPIHGTEIVRVGIDATGRERAIVVDQTLVIHGTGDFTIEVPGPASAVEAPVDASARPGLRLGSVIWEGFSAGERTVRATVTLDTDAPTFRSLPLRITIAPATEPCSPGPCGGTTITITNTTVEQRDASVATPDARALGTVLDEMRAQLRSRRAPVAGRDGLATSIPALGPVSRERVDVVVPMRVRGSVDRCDGDPCTPTRATGVDVVVGDRPVTIRVPSPTPDPQSLRLDLAAEPVDPPAADLDPHAVSWRTALENASPAQARAALILADRTLWSVLRRGDVESFLGNPLGGPSRARYEFRTDVTPAASTSHTRPESANVVAIALSLLGAVAAGSGAVAVWRKL